MTTTNNFNTLATAATKSTWTNADQVLKTAISDISYNKISCDSIGETYVSKEEFNLHVNPPKPDVDPETKLTLNCNGKTIAATSYENGYRKKTWAVIPDIIDVLVYNDRVVTVKFADRTEEKAVLHPEDKFSIEQGVSICIAKKLSGGSAIYNKIVEHALKVKQDNEITKAKQREEIARKKEQNRQDNLKRAERNRKKREREINNMAAAFKTAITDFMKEVKNNEEA